MGYTIHMNLLAKLLVSRDDKFLFVEHNINSDIDDGETRAIIDLPTADVANDSISAVGQALSIALNQDKNIFKVKDRLFWWQYRAQESAYYFGPHNLEIWIYRGEIALKDISRISLEGQDKYMWLTLLEAEDLGFDINLSGLISHSINS